MNEIYSNANDCFNLAKYLKEKMGSKIDFYGSTHQEVIIGTYFSDYTAEQESLPFYFKFCKEGFLRIGIGSYHPHNNSVGEKLAALSNFYEVLNEQYGEPTVFYTIKNDQEKNLSLQWSFINKKEDIQSFKDGEYFDDAEIDELIVIGEQTSPIGSYHLNDSTKKLIAKQVGVPFELITLVDENIKDFIKYKKGEEFSITEKSTQNKQYQKKISTRTMFAKHKKHLL